VTVEHAGETPVFVGVGALRTARVLANVENAQRAGAATRSAVALFTEFGGSLRVVDAIAGTSAC
jgi:dihydrodipicolinate synthase/N-acetylneuraminate lyase